MSQPALRSQQVAAHRAVAREQVLDRPRQAVAGVRHAVGRRRAFVEDERRRAGPLLERLLVDALLFPELQIWSSSAGKLTLLATG